MPSAVRLREDYSAEELRALARRSKDVNQSRRLLSLAAVRDGMDRGSAARIGGMDRQTLRDWVHRFNAAGPEGLIDNWTEGPKPRLSAEQLVEFAAIVEVGPDREKDGVVRWRRVDLKRVIAERFGVDYHRNSQAGVSLFGNSFRGKAEWGAIFRDGGVGNMSQGMDDSATRASGPDCCIAERD